MVDSGELDALVEEAVEEKLNELVEERRSEIEKEQQSTTVSRRRTLGLAGLVGLGAIGAGSHSVGAVEGHSLSQDLDCNQYDLTELASLRAGHTYSSYISKGDGNGNLQLYDGEAGSPFLRASEDTDSSGPGPIMFNAPIRGVPEGAAGGDIYPKSLQIIDDVVFNGNDLQDVGAINGGVTAGERLESLAGQNLMISNGQLNAAGGDISDDLENRIDDAITRLEVVGGTANQWRVGPTRPAGEYHGTGPWGILIDADRSAYLGECTIDSNMAGQFSAALYEYDRDSDTLVSQVDSITIQATGSEQTIFLDFLIDEPGEYLLTRLIPEEDSGETDSYVPDDIWKPEDDQIELKRISGYNGYENDSQNGVTLQGGYNPYAADSTNSSYYYYFDLEISSANSA